MASAVVAGGRPVRLMSADDVDWILLPNMKVRRTAEPLRTADRMLRSPNVVLFCRDIISSRRGCRNVPGEGMGVGVGATVAA